MKVVIMGCGRVGALLATSLDRDGHEVTVLDLRASQFERFLPAEFAGRRVVGDGRDQDVLRAAGVEDADAFVACTQGDNRNVMAAQMARTLFNVPRAVFAGLNSDSRPAATMIPVTCAGSGPAVLETMIVSPTCNWERVSWGRRSINS